MLSRTAEPPLDCMESKPTAWTTNKWRQTDCLDNKQTDDSGCIANCSLALKVRVTLNASDRRDNGCIANYSPLLAMALSCPTCPPKKQIGTNFSWMRGESTSSQKGLHRRQGLNGLTLLDSMRALSDAAAASQRMQRSTNSVSQVLS